MNGVINSWTFGSVPLASFGAVTELDSYLDIPAKRNENVLVPLMDGRLHAPKFFDQKTVSFGIEIIAQSIAELETKFDTMKALFGLRTQQYLAYWSSTGYRRAYAEVTGQMSVTRDPDPLVAKVVVDFLLAEPFFRSDVLYSNEVSPVDTNPKAQTILNAGTVEERAAVIKFTGPMGTPKLLHVASGIYVQYNAALTGTDTVTIDCRAWTAVHSALGNVINNIVHYGDPCFMVFLPGYNTMSIIDTVHTTGKCKVEFYPPYL